MTINQHPSNKFKMCVNVAGIGCVFIGTRDDCNEYIADNSWRYRKAMEATV